MTATTAPPSFLATCRGKLILLLLCAIAFLDFVDASIVNIALPDIGKDLHFSVQNLQWVLSGYLLTYGGFMLLGGRLGDLLGRRSVLVTGTAVFATSSLVAQGVGAALMLPAALSLLTTNFTDGKDRTTAMGVWGGVAGPAAAAGVLLGGLLTEGRGWRWVLFVNPPIAAVLLVTASQRVGGALGLAIFSAIATARTNPLLAERAAHAHALTAGFHRALLAECFFVLTTAFVAMRTRNSRGEADHRAPEAEATLEPAVLS